MTGLPTHALRAARLLAQRRATPPARALSREEGVGVVAQAILERSRRRRLKFFVGAGVLGASAAAAALVFALGWARKSEPLQASACRAGEPCADVATVDKGSVDGQPFLPGAHVATTAERSRVIEFATGTRMTLGRSAELEYRAGAGTRRFGLLRGELELSVSKLSPGQRFVIETPDAEVEVRGTVFEVGVANPETNCGAQTRVSVTEGMVEVRSGRRNVRLTAGESWPQCSEDDAASDAAQPASRSGEHARANDDARPRSEGSTTAQRLTEQNDLFAEAVNARREGRSVAAVAAYDRLIGRFPNGPLVESATVERIRILKSLNPSRARELARRYLTRFPNGFARTEMEGLVRQP